LYTEIVYARRESMKTDIQTLLDTIADLRDRATANAVFSAPVTVEGRTVIPVAKIGYAFGLAGGHIRRSEQETTDTLADGATGEAVAEGRGDTKGSTGLGGVSARPMAIIEVTPEGVRVEPIVDEQKLSLVGAMLAGWFVFWLTRALIKIFGERE
jgi:uncharacterized spore protein YtfJ